MRQCQLKVVKSSLGNGSLSLRGPKGKGHGDPIHPHITNSFKDGDDVVVIHKEDFENLVAKVKGS